MLLYVNSCFCQKKTLDTGILNNWPLIKKVAISGDGRYIMYTIRYQLKGSGTLVIQSTHTNQQTTLPGILSSEMIEAKGTIVLFLNKSDSLGIVSLADSTTEYIPHVKTYRLFKQKQIIAYLSEKGLVIRNLLTGKQHVFTGAVTYELSDDGNILLLQRAGNLERINLLTGNKAIIYNGAKPGNLVQDPCGTQIAFIVGDTLWYYQVETGKAVTLINGQVDGISTFSKDGSKLFFTLKENISQYPGPDAVKVDVWSYKDSRLQSQQLVEELWPRSFAAVIRLKDHQIIRLEQENEVVLIRTDDVAWISHSKGNIEEDHWNSSVKPSYYIMSVNNGERKPTNIRMSVFSESTGGKYLVDMDTTGNDLYSYELATGESCNITATIAVPLIDSTFDLYMDQRPRGFEVVAWLENDAALLVYDQYDIWRLDPSGKLNPVNLTNGYGRRHNIIFRLADNYTGKTIAFSEELILVAFDRQTKESGFYKKKVSQRGDPVRLTMGPYYYDLPGNNSFCELSSIKALNSAIYLVKRESATKSSNCFLTLDFKTFTPLSNIYPEKAYNWLNVELLNWVGPDNRPVQGLLYKPENFDAAKQYPVIFHFYERMSDELNKYRVPSFTGVYGPLNIPLAVSQGYLVFIPDIYYKTGSPGPSAFDAVMSAAGYLSKFPWVDTTRMGLQGHSWGGYETNYIITHTHLFAAAMSSAGPSDLISDYGDLFQSGQSRQPLYEVRQFRMKATLWDQRTSYISNSPIFDINNVTTPLLIMHNKKDSNVPFSQGIELFTALRRLGKKAWMLQYDDDGHGIFFLKDATDYTIRLTQFFNYYLNGAPPPKWMTKGIPASKKGIDTGLEPDTSGAIP